jgi:hypothetical protein
MQFTYDSITTAATEAIAEMTHDGGQAGPAPRRAVGAGVYLLWAHIVGSTAQEADDRRIMDLISAIA